MASLKLKHFGSTEALRSVSSQSLLSLLREHGDYFESQGVRLDITNNGNLDYEALVGVFAAPDADMPAGLLDALYHIEEMSTPEAMDDLLREAEERDLGLDPGDDCTPMDVAVGMWVKNRTLLERITRGTDTPEAQDVRLLPVGKLCGRRRDVACRRRSPRT